VYLYAPALEAAHLLWSWSGYGPGGGEVSSQQAMDIIIIIIIIIYCNWVFTRWQ
jgi:hypothetical protein